MVKMVTTGITGVNAATDLAEFDAILAVFDENGAIEENMMFVDRSTSLAMDDMLASMNSYGAGGTSYGVFDNSEDMALNLGFSGFRRGSYDFYKSDFKYLNDKGTRGGLNDTVNAIRGVVIPAGVSSVYDEQLGKNMKRPFLHVRYRASETENRKLKTWVTGSVGALTSGVTGVNAATDLAEFDAILAEFDKQGAIEENMMFVNRSVSLAMDDMLASMNSYGAGGTSYGVFNNSEDMALNLGFSGFRRGSYDFYKSDWKYLNDQGTRGGLNDTINAIRGVVIPAGVSSVYDESLGKNLKRPFLHVRYRASQTESRKYKTWITGSVGATTSGVDAMQVHYLSERCLVTQGANNFMLMN